MSANSEKEWKIKNNPSFAALAALNKDSHEANETKGLKMGSILGTAVSDVCIEDPSFHCIRLHLKPTNLVAQSRGNLLHAYFTVSRWLNREKKLVVLAGWSMMSLRD